MNTKITEPQSSHGRAGLGSLVIAGILSFSPLLVAQADVGDLVVEFDLVAAKFALNPVRNELYASIPGTNSVAVIDVDTLQLLATPFVGSGPKGVAVSADGLELYVANSGSSALAVLDTLTRTVSSTIALPTLPSDVVTGNGYLYVTPGTSAAGIMQIDTSTGSYVGDFSGGVSVYSGGLLAISPDKNTLYFANRGLSPGTLGKYDVSSPTPTLLLKNPHGALGSNGQDLALSHDGTFASYAVGGGNGPGYGIYKLDSDDLSSMGEFVTGPYPREITFSHDDKSAYAVNQSGEIKVFDTGTFLHTMTIPTIGEARELIIDRSGRYLFAAFDDKLRVYHTGHGSIASSNEPPIADAGSDQAVETGAIVTLDGTSSIDPDATDPLIFDWMVIQKPAGSLAILSEGASPNPTFTADVDGDYVIELIVTDSLDTPSDPDTVLITAYPKPTVGGSATAVQLTKVICINLSTGKRVKLYDHGPVPSWDCEAAGLAVNPGDSIRMNVFGVVD